MSYQIGSVWTLVRASSTERYYDTEMPELIFTDEQSAKNCCKVLNESSGSAIWYVDTLLNRIYEIMSNSYKMTN